MVQSSLVNDVIEEGERFVRQLRTDGFVVHGAFWLYDDAAPRWRLYIVTDRNPLGAAAAYKEAGRSFYSLQPRSFDMNSVTLTYPSDPRAVAVNEFQTKYPTSLPTNVRDQYLGSVYFEDSYIYPSTTS